MASRVQKHVLRFQISVQDVPGMINIGFRIQGSEFGGRGLHINP